MPEIRSSSNDERKEIKENRVSMLDTPTKIWVRIKINTSKCYQTECWMKMTDATVVVSINKVAHSNNHKVNLSLFGIIFLKSQRKLLQLLQFVILTNLDCHILALLRASVRVLLAWCNWNQWKWCASHSSSCFGFIFKDRWIIMRRIVF